MRPSQITLDPTTPDDTIRMARLTTGRKKVRIRQESNSECISRDQDGVCAAHLAVFAKNIAFVSNDHSCVPYDLSMGFITLKYWVDDDHFVLLSMLLQHLGGWSCVCRLSKF